MIQGWSSGLNCFREQFHCVKTQTCLKENLCFESRWTREKLEPLLTNEYFSCLGRIIGTFFSPRCAWPMLKQNTLLWFGCSTGFVSSSVVQENFCGGGW